MDVGPFSLMNTSDFLSFYAGAVVPPNITLTVTNGTFTNETSTDETFSSDSPAYSSFGSTLGNLISGDLTLLSYLSVVGVLILVMLSSF